MLHPFVDRLKPLMRFLKETDHAAAALIADLSGGSLLAALEQSVKASPRFAGARFSELESFRLYRTMLYVVVRVTRPAWVLETGVLHGFSSAFILQAMADNGCGRLSSIDLPSRSLDLIDQGTADLPEEQNPGWAIPEPLRERHSLSLGPAETLLPSLVPAQGVPDIFLHDSDHSYAHMMMELSFLWSHMRSGLLIADNIEQNDCFSDFARGSGALSLVLASFDEPGSAWRHGLLQATR
jgi:hypothetical protein